MVCILSANLPVSLSPYPLSHALSLTVAMETMAVRKKNQNKNRLTCSPASLHDPWTYRVCGACNRQRPVIESDSDRHRQDHRGLGGKTGLGCKRSVSLRCRQVSNLANTLFSTQTPRKSGRKKRVSLCLYPR